MPVAGSIGHPVPGEARSRPIVAILPSLSRPAAAPDDAPGERLRRCTYRRLIAVQKRPEAVYEAECLYGVQGSALADDPVARDDIVSTDVPNRIDGTPR